MPLSVLAQAGERAQNPLVIDHWQVRDESQDEIGRALSTWKRNARRSPTSTA
jgi:hypothetical protein